jgi:NADH-quinone oxidoreductase subunit L
VDILRQQFPESDFALLAVVLLLPALGAFVNGVFGKRLGKEGVRLMALSAIGGAFLASLLTFFLLPHAEEGEGAPRLVWKAWEWLSITGRPGFRVGIDVAFGVDAMSATMMLVITGVGFLIHLYASEYMREDDGYHRFFSYLNLFCFAMLILVMADNLAILFVGWEGVGLCSYLLIGFWYGEEKNASAGKKAFITNRIGDFGLLVAMAMLVYYVGSLSWTGIDAGATNLLQTVKIWPIGNMPTELEWDKSFASTSMWPAFLVHLFLPEEPVRVFAATLVGLALLLGCAGKSAQLPLYVWLPDAMAGPTPVSALIHAATMVTAGVYLVARTSSIFLLSPAALGTVMIVGAATAFFAATIGLLQRDLKKVLAYSTVSQLGFMFIGVGSGAFFSGFFHVFTHAFFKACLFLGAGSVIHAMHARIHDTDKSQDMRNMGGLKQYMPLTRWTFLVSCLAIAGAPGLSGFWSKDEILWKAYSNVLKARDVTGSVKPFTWPDWLGPTVYWVGVAAATMTAFYMFRAYFLTFHGPFRGWKIVKGWKASEGHDAHGHADHAHHAEESGPLEGPVPHESPLAMTLPLVVLAAFALAAGFLAAEPIHVAPLAHMMEPIWEKAKTVVVARPESEGMMWVMMAPGVGAFLAGTAAAIVIYLNRQGAPELAFAERFPRLYKLVFEKWRIDELYDATVIGTVDALADIFTMADKWIIDGILAKLTALGVSLIGTLLRAFHTGRVQVYSASMVVGLAGVGWFMTTPTAEATMDDSGLRKSGEVVLAAAPGYGYTYKWSGDGVEGRDDWSPRFGKLTVKLEPGQQKNVVLHVRNAFGREEEETFSLARPKASPGGGVIPVNFPPSGSVIIPGDQIPNLIQPGTVKP